jgi:hypothetical protein
VAAASAGPEARKKTTHASVARSSFVFPIVCSEFFLKERNPFNLIEVLIIPSPFS